MDDCLNFNYELLFTSASCACRPNTLAWCRLTSYIVFAAKKDICIVGYDASSSYYRVFETVEATQSGEITSVDVSRTEDSVNPESANGHSLVSSSSSSGEITIFKLVKGSHNRLTSIGKVKRNSNVDLAIIAPFNVAQSKYLLANSQFDQIEAQIISKDGDELNSVLSFRFPNSIVLSLASTKMLGTVLMAVGLSTGSIEVLELEHGAKSLEKKLSINSAFGSWVRSLAFKVDGETVWLAGADEVIRIWKFAIKEETPTDWAGALTLTPTTFAIKKDENFLEINILLESVVSSVGGHIHSLDWHPSEFELLSTGSDRSVVRWKYSSTDSLWLPKSWLGGVGEEQITFYDGIYSPDGQFVLCHSLLGSFYFWNLNSKEIALKSFPVSGHFDEVTDLCWDSSGTFLITCSFDMTTRIFASLKQSDKFFFEVARPQTHGHALNCVSSVRSDLFISGGEEKIFRVFQASCSFGRNLNLLAKNYTNFEHFENLPMTAFQTELTLTNKAVTDTDGGENDALILDSFLFNDLPHEDQLSKLSLYPEMHKLYGHGFEVFSCTLSHNGYVLATSCKASQCEHAVVLLWNAHNWQRIQYLKAHQLTVTRMAFSMDDKFLLCVSRDRTWTLFRVIEETCPFGYELHCRVEKTKSKHSRIIWDCAWAPDVYLFATSSRDKTLKLWNLTDENKNSENEVINTATFTSEEAQTAVDFAPKRIHNSSYLIVIGLENGWIIGIRYDSITHSIQNLSTFSRDSGRINRLRFRPLIDEENESESSFMFASASVNWVVKIHKINI